MTLGDVIRNRRIKLGMNQQELAQAIDTTTATVSRWESGNIQKMKRPMIERLSNVLMLDPMIFMQQEEVLMPDEFEVIEAYRLSDFSTKNAVRRVLGIEEKNIAQQVG